ncbi:helix-turn-helix transcriptional regulator [Flavobacterium sp. MAH-1]|uniref:Helix-turn-helix transcriptional regulator n=1 Tax=Flavobacterium agri TaxID=2743471 RepID=A0A7Y8Y3Z4_9FLAO|nr:AraC family transcriptional regulator [Flavobacterium agri]NUY81908.1 helix-turn-helix transcriptional regulator [Flavobacterium agri]NYA71932.1 helix-turn-helix transcriptional regulator [Flavobacterium agri]
MELQVNQERLGNFQRILLQVAGRNFETCLSGEKYPGDALPLFMDLLAKDIKGNLFRPGYLAPYRDYPHLSPFTFVLDGEGRVENFSSEAGAALGYRPVSLLKKPFGSFLAAESKPLWNEIERHSSATVDFGGMFQITFCSGIRSLLQAFCTVRRMGNSRVTVVNALLPVAAMPIPVFDEPVDIRRENEAKRLEQLYHYILGNLEAPLPSAYDLAKMLGTNDHALKEGFRRVFGTSIYQFYITEKLKRAHLLIEQSVIPLHKIAADLGFGTYSNFSRAFRQKYGYAPSQVKRWDEWEVTAK